MAFQNNCPFLGKIIHVQRREYHDHKQNRVNPQENQARVQQNDGRSSNMNSTAISFSVADVADLAARLTLNYANQGNFNARQALPPRVPGINVSP